MKKRFTEGQIVGFLREANAGGTGQGPVSQARVLRGEPCSECLKLPELPRAIAILKIPTLAACVVVPPLRVMTAAPPVLVFSYRSGRPQTGHKRSTAATDGVDVSVG
jgi:hypothetical protein